MDASGLKFASAVSHYETLVDIVTHDHIYWSSKCEGEFFLSKLYQNEYPRSSPSYELITILCISGLGYGWGPAILETEREISFVVQAQKGFNNIRSYWIGGFTDIDPGNIIQHYSDYFTSRSGHHTKSYLFCALIGVFCDSYLFY